MLESCIFLKRMYASIFGSHSPVTTANRSWDSWRQDQTQQAGKAREGKFKAARGPPASGLWVHPQLLNGLSAGASIGLKKVGRGGAGGETGLSTRPHLFFLYVHWRNVSSKWDTRAQYSIVFNGLNRKNKQKKKISQKNKIDSKMKHYIALYIYIYICTCVYAHAYICPSIYLLIYLPTYVYVFPSVKCHLLSSFSFSPVTRLYITE